MIELVNPDADVWVAILSFCNISSVISASQTCKWMHSLAFSKSVWISLVRYLESRAFIDTLPDQDIGELSTPELVDLAKRTIRGPKSWSPPYSNTISRQHVLHPSRQGPFLAQLLPGGRYVLIKDTALQCWSVVDDALVWEYSSSQASSGQRTYTTATDALDTENVLICIIELSSEPMYPRYDYFIDIVQLNLTTGISRSLFDYLLLSALQRSYLDLRYLDIRGDTAVVLLKTQLYLINWKTQACIIFDILKDNASLYDIVQTQIRFTFNHIVILTQSSPSDVPEISVWDINLFADHWSTKDARDNWHSGYIGDIAPTVSASPNHPSIFQNTHKTLAVHQSVLEEDHYIVTATFTYRNREAVLPQHSSAFTCMLATVFTYSLSISEPLLSTSYSSSRPHRETLLHFKSQTILNLNREFLTDSANHVCYAGHVMLSGRLSAINPGRRLAYNRILNLRHLTGAEHDGIVLTELEDADDNILMLSNYGGAIAYCGGDSTVIIKYYL